MARKIAIVVQRYGKEVLGGSESLAADVAACLSTVYDVEVLTTCAKDYVTWKNEFPEGATIEDGIKVRRFAVDRPRHALFSYWNWLLMYVPHFEWMEKVWIRMQGPYSSGLINYVKERRNEYDTFIFVTYLYGTTFYCLPHVAEKAILLPTAHNEPYIHFRIYRDIFGAAKWLIFLTEEEKALTDGIFGTEKKGTVIGAPIKELEAFANGFREKYGIFSPFILYVGRVDKLKNVQVLLNYFERYRMERKNDIKLVLCGSGPLKVSQDGVVCTGFMPEEDKYGAIRAAIAVVLPSRYESFSYSMLEAMLCCTPTLVNGECHVLKGHCEKSRGGMCYNSYEEFRDALDAVLGDPGLRKRMGEAGRAYVMEHYSMDAVRKKYITTIDDLINGWQRTS
ncbi:Glycosyltransferase [Methanocella conradii HZ254]|uniref:Glycosyltransferase n=1 Tax=Methanocella conradii (strain DSM 24694 / JCM 17849 / CGMCC 1.5162 / HZ254) TaxID=1041930 RepID=H8I6Q4_METCZ|nr:glycosyltransferase family 4 protein [Methanocella conradii]AFC99374.1 Glycosyltransferase [Methanocella conradii HZ254]